MSTSVKDILVCHALALPISKKADTMSELTRLCKSGSKSIVQNVSWTHIASTGTKHQMFAMRQSIYNSSRVGRRRGNVKKAIINNIGVSSTNDNVFFFVSFRGNDEHLGFSHQFL